VKAIPLFCALLLAGLLSAAGQTSSPTAAAINALGLDLVRQGSGGRAANGVWSPYSIQLGLAMTYAGAAGKTRAEMGRVLHYGEGDMSRALAALNRQIVPKEMKSPIQFEIANRLFGQKGFEFRPEFLSFVRKNYGAPVEELDFRANPANAAREINHWVARQTHDRIRDLIPPSALTPLTRLVLANAIYFKAPWQDEFNARVTEPQIFHSASGGASKVPTMMRAGQIGYAKQRGFRAIALPYQGAELQFLILLPDKADGLPGLEAKLTPELLAECANLPASQVQLWLPKFKLEPPSSNLKALFLALGMTQAFDVPQGSANFDGMVDGNSANALCISDIFHQAFLSIDEKGTEAAAATAVVMVLEASMRPSKPVEVRVDHPFFFAVQHKTSGACLFLGRVTDLR
jgi:serpin B